VNPGDLVVGDADGVVIIPRENAAEIIDKAAGKVQAEAKRIAEINAGKLGAPWLKSALVAAGVLGEEESL